MTVTSLPVRDEYTGTAAQTVFNYTFLIFTNQDLNVYVTPVGQGADDSTDLTTAYTVDVATIGDPTGGFITLNSGVSAGDLVTIVSNIVDNRTTDYQNSGDFLPDVVNEDFDRVVSIAKQTDDRSGRTLAFPESLQNATSLTMPLPEAGLYVKWNPAETGLINTGAPGTLINTDLTGTSIDMIANTSLVVGDYVPTTGRLANGDGGDNTYEVVAGGTGTDDGGSYLDLANGLQAKGLFPSGIVNAKQFGALGEGATDDKTKIQNADAFGAVLFTEGDYRISSNLTFTKDVTFGSGATLNVDSSIIVTFIDGQGIIQASWFGAVGDGVVANESPSIQAAIDASAGKRLEIDDGTYLIQTSLQIDSNTELAVSMNATIKRNASIDNMIRNKADGVAGGYTANNNIHIRGGIWDANKTGFPSNITAIVFGHCRDVSVTDVSVLGVKSWHCIEFNAVLEGRIDNCRFTLCERILTAEAVQLDIMVSVGNFPWFGPYDNTPCKDIWVTNNYFEDVGSGVGSHTAVIGVVHENIFIINNVFRNLSNKGVVTLNYSSVKIQGNHFTNMDFGITCDVNATAVKDYLIEGNSTIAISDTGLSRGIWVVGGTASGRLLSRISITNNIVQAIGYHGLAADFCNHIVLQGNIVTDCQNAGMWVFGCRNFAVTGNEVDSNDLSASGSGDFTVGVTGTSNTINGSVIGNYFGTARIADADYVIMRQNSIRTSMTLGAAITNSSTNENLVAGVLS